MIYKGKALRLGDHVDTDAIIPARFMVTTDPAILGANCMAGMDPTWVKQVQPTDIMVGGINFGCGSSREHAPIAILGAGIKAVVAGSFARIFYRNSLNIGLPLFEIGDAVNDIAHGHQLSIDSAAGKIQNLTTGKTYDCPPLPETIMDILNAGGLEGYVQAKLKAKR